MAPAADARDIASRSGFWLHTHRGGTVSSSSSSSGAVPERPPNVHASGPSAGPLGVLSWPSFLWPRRHPSYQPYIPLHEVVSQPPSASNDGASSPDRRPSLSESAAAAAELAGGHGFEGASAAGEGGSERLWRGLPQPPSETARGGHAISRRVPQRLAGRGAAAVRGTTDRLSLLARPCPHEMRPPLSLERPR